MFALVNHWTLSAMAVGNGSRMPGEISSEWSWYQRCPLHTVQCCCYRVVFLSGRCLTGHQSHQTREVLQRHLRCPWPFSATCKGEKKVKHVFFSLVNPAKMKSVWRLCVAYLQSSGPPFKVRCRDYRQRKCLRKVKGKWNGSLVMSVSYKQLNYG